MPSSSRWSKIGPAILLTATSVGAGDILTGSLAGSHAGLAVLWAVPAGILLKWTLTEGIARWQMATGTTLLEGWVRKLGGWIQWVFLVYLLLFTVVTAAMLSSACGIAGAALVPLGGLQESRLAWGAIHSLAAAALVMWGGYELLKKVLAGCVGAMFAAVTLTAVLLRPDWSAVARGFMPSEPAGSAGWIVGLIGAIGGTMALISYGYWIREEGRTGRKGLDACRFDLLLSYAVIGVFGIAVVIVGSRSESRGRAPGWPCCWPTNWHHRSALLENGFSWSDSGRLYFRRCSAYGRVFRICSPTSCDYAAARRCRPISPSLDPIGTT